LLDRWDGVTLYVAADPTGLAGIPMRHSWLYSGLPLHVAFAGLALLWWAFARAGSSSGKSSLWSAQALGPLGLSVLGALLLVLGVERFRVRGVGEPHRQTGIVSAEPVRLSLISSESNQDGSFGRASGSIWIRNRGAMPARIQRIVPSCTCARVAPPTSPVIPAGGAARFDITVDLRGKAAQRVNLVVELTDAIPERLTLQVDATARNRDGQPP
jgi:hypothetical protein